MNETALQALTAILRPDGDHPKGAQVYWLLSGVAGAGRGVS